MQYELKCQAFFYVKYIPSYPYENSNLCRKELTVHWSVPNSLIRSYLLPCTNSMWGDESEAVAPIIWLYQIVDAQKEEVFFPELLITLLSYVQCFLNLVILFFTPEPQRVKVYVCCLCSPIHLSVYLSTCPCICWSVRKCFSTLFETWLEYSFLKIVDKFNHGYCSSLHMGMMDWKIMLCDIFSCDQAALRTPLSVCPSVCLSVTPFSLCSCHRIATKFSGVITNDKSVKVKVIGQRSRSQRS